MPCWWSTGRCCRHPSTVAHRDVVLPDNLVADDNVAAGGLEPPHELFAKLAIHRLQRRLQVVPAVAEVEDTDADLTRL